MSSAALDRLENVLDELAALSLDACTDDEVLDVLRRLETVKRRLAPLDHAVINQVESRSLAFTHGARSTAVLLRQLLRVAPAEATARVKAAEALGHRRTFTGAEVEPRYPLVAAAQAAGVLSDRHAAVISTRIVKPAGRAGQAQARSRRAPRPTHRRAAEPRRPARHAEPSRTGPGYCPPATA